MNYFLIPIFNEEQNLELLHSNLTAALSGEEKFYVFADDGSSDNSVKMIRDLFSEEKFIVLGDGSNYGPGYSFNSGFRWILQHSQNSADKIITMEGDNTSDLGILPHMTGISDLGYDLVLASVYAQGGGFDKTSFFRKLISSIANLFMRYAFDIKILTLSSFYRVYHVALIKRIDIKYKEIIEEKGFISMLEILRKAIHCEAKIIEVPMTLRSLNRKGKSKMKVFKTGVSYMKFLMKSDSSFRK